jgi:hypothetical protein
VGPFPGGVPTCTRARRGRPVYKGTAPMISDILFQAVQAIERYQREMPHHYDQLRAEIDEVKAAMRGLQRRLDRALERPEKSDREDD